MISVAPNSRMVPVAATLSLIRKVPLPAFVAETLVESKKLLDRALAESAMLKNRVKQRKRARVLVPVRFIVMLRLLRIDRIDDLF